MNDKQIPADMIEKAARQLWSETADWLDFDDEEEGFDAQPHDTQEQIRDYARAVLAAALAECEVREEWRETTRGLKWAPTLDEAASFAWFLTPEDAESGRYERRVFITTPAEDVTAVDTPAQEGTAT